VSAAIDAASARMVRRTVQQWPLIAACAVLAAVAAFALAAREPKQYQAVTTLQLSEIDVGSLLLSENLQQQGQDAQKKAATNAKLIMLPRVREAASRALDGAVTPAQLKESVEVVSDPNTTLVEIHARAEQPRQAAATADAMRESFVAIRRQAAVSRLRAAQRGLEARLESLSPFTRRGPTGASLRGRIQDLDQLAAASNGGIETVQTARIPTRAVAPAPARSAILGLIGGGLFGLLLALLRTRLDDQVRDLDELTDLWELPVLGRIPEEPQLSEAGRIAPSGAVLEAFALARTNLRYLHLGADVRTIVVTSAVSGEGKSTVAVNLATAAALAGSRVLLVDADLRRPVLATRLGITARYGLSEVLAAIAEPSDAIVTVPIEGVGRAVGSEIAVLAAGMQPPSPITLFERPRAQEILAGLRDDYDLVIIDSPPATVVADAKVLVEHVDGVVLVSRLGHVSREAVHRLREALAGTPTPVLGWIVNASISPRANAYDPYLPTER
jgi:capsular exopolysaccharide synthesis family protein